MKNLNQFKLCLFLLFMFVSGNFAKGDVMENKNLYNEILKSAERSSWSSIAAGSKENPDEYLHINFKTGQKQTIFKNSKAQLSESRIVISPNGKYGAFWVNEDYASYSLEIVDLISNQIKRILNIKKGCCIAWSPDSKQIAFLTVDANTEYTLNVIDISNQRSHKFLTGNIDFLTEQAWSYDGKKIVYSYKNSIFTYDINSKSVTSLTNGSWASWSPLSNTILFFDAQNNSLNLFKMETGKNEHLLFGQELGEGSLTLPVYWFPNGKYIFIGHLSPQDTEIGYPYVLDVESHEVEKLFDFSWCFSSWGRGN